MKKNILVFAVSLCVALEALAVDLSKMDSLQRREYLIEKSKEVIMTVCPACYREYGEPEIVGPKECFIDEYCLQIYPDYRERSVYYVIRKYDIANEKMICDYSSIVGIWEDTGLVQKFSLGYGFGYDFTFHSYEEWLETKPVLPIPNKEGKLWNFY